MILVVKNLPANAGHVRDAGLIPGSGGSPGGGHASPLQYSCLENPYGQRNLAATVHRFSQSWTRLKVLSMHAHRFKHISVNVAVTAHLYVFVMHLLLISFSLFMLFGSCIIYGLATQKYSHGPAAQPDLGAC